MKRSKLILVRLPGDIRKDLDVYAENGSLWATFEEDAFSIPCGYVVLDYTNDSKEYRAERLAEARTKYALARFLLINMTKDDKDNKVSYEMVEL